MNTIVVPVDFSPTAHNAARYAVRMLTGTYDVNLVLYHVYDKESEKEEAERQLEDLKNELSTLGIVKITYHAETSDDFAESLNKFARHRAAQIIIMGLTGKTKLSQIFLSSNTLKIVHKNPCPVMIIPPSAEFSAIKNVVLTSDFKEVDVTIPFEPIKFMLGLFNANLHIINVNAEHYVALTQEYLAERNRMAEMFTEFKPEFYFIGTYDFHETINQFVEDHNIDLIITIPRSHSFIENLFKTSNTKKLVFESTVPVLAAHE